MMTSEYRLGIDIGSTTVKIAIIDKANNILFSDYERHFANIQETLAGLLVKAKDKLGAISVATRSSALSVTKRIPATRAITRTFTTGAMAVGNARPAFFVKKAGKSTSQTLKDGNPLCGSGSSQISSPRRAAWNATPRMWCGSF